MIENRKRALVRAVVAVAVGSCALPALAADGTWIGATGNSWSDSGSWAGGIVPGAVGAPYTNTDTANFVNLTGTSGADPIDIMLVNIDANRSIGNMFVDNLNSVSVVIGTNAGEALRLTNGGTTSTGTSFTNTTTGTGNINFTIAAPLIVEGNTYNFVSNAPAGRQGGIQITGPLTFTGAGAKTLVLGGTNADTGAGNQSQNQINSTLTDSGGGPVGIVKNGTGTWELNNFTGFNTYSGDTVVNAGFLRLRGVESGGVVSASGVSPNSTYIANGGILRFSTPGLTAKAVVLNNPTVTNAGLNYSNSTIFVNLKNESGPALVMNFNAAPTSQISGRVVFTGTTPEQGGIELNNGGNLITGVDLGSTSANWDLGSVLRPVKVDLGADTNSYDLRFRGQLNGTGGLLKLGAGRLRIDQTVNPITGTIEVREGTLLMNNPNAFTGLPNLLISGGSMNINGGHTQRFGSVTLTKGIITQSNSNTGITLLSPTIAFNPAIGDRAEIEPTISDDPSGPTSVVMNGQGTGILSNLNNNYTGATTVNSGTLLINGAHTGGAAYSVAGGRLGGTGTISATVNVTGGRVSPGQSVGSLTIDGPLNIAGPGGVRVEIESAGSFDQLVVNGAKSLGGSMEIEMLAGYNPLPADSFAVISGAGAVSGSFSTNPWGLITVLGGGKAFLPQYGATDVILTDFARAGDVNRDGAVNNLDIATFVSLLTGAPASGSVGFAGDVNADGLVNNLDIAPFVALLTGGRPVGDDPDFQPLLSLVPEPASLSLLALGGLMLGRRRRA